MTLDDSEQTKEPAQGAEKAATVLVCNCENTMDIDGKVLARALGQTEPLTVFNQLCRGQIGGFEAVLKNNAPVCVACTQEAPLFREIAESAGRDDISFTNIRERAGWCVDKASAQPKMAALLAEAAFSPQPAGVTTLKSEGVCLVYGSGQQALDVAEQLAGRLSVSLLLAEPGDAHPPAIANVPIASGRIRQARGSLGNFEIIVDGYAAILPSSRSELTFVMPRDGASSSCDLILDISGDTALFSDADHRDGYFRADPGRPAAVAKSMFEIADMVGEFEKPLYVHYNPDICAHSRSGKSGCTNCIDHCPTSAISPAGDIVEIDPHICGGCGDCSAMCPTGAVSYSYPRNNDIIQRGRILADTFVTAGGNGPILLLHDETHGAEVIAAMARFGDGLPVNVLPLSLHSAHTVGHDILLATVTSAASQIVVLAAPERAVELAALSTQINLANACLDALGHSDRRIHLINDADPDVIASQLASVAATENFKPIAFEALGDKRQTARTALGLLRDNSVEKPELISLPEGSPYGRIKINTQGCTLCLACVSACPANALSDNQERPQVNFTEAACVQCGICVATCPENVITLDPRMNFATDALSPQILNEEEPFECISCGKPFGTKSAIERVGDQLAGKHSMFASSAQADLIKMCDNCRVVAVNQDANPMAKGERPLVRTTEDYIEAEAKARETGRKPEDFLS